MRLVDGEPVEEVVDPRRSAVYVGCAAFLTLVGVASVIVALGGALWLLR